MRHPHDLEASGSNLVPTIYILIIRASTKGYPYLLAVSCLKPMTAVSPPKYCVWIP